MTEFGVVMEASPGVTAPLATKLENMGFDYLLCPDTQNLSPDPYGQLSLVSSVTESIKMGTGVTNPLTRVSAVTATAMMSLQKNPLVARYVVLAEVIPPQHISGWKTPQQPNYALI